MSHGVYADATATWHLQADLCPDACHSHAAPQAVTHLGLSDSLVACIDGMTFKPDTGGRPERKRTFDQATAELLEVAGAADTIKVRHALVIASVDPTAPRRLLHSVGSRGLKQAVLLTSRCMHTSSPLPRKQQRCDILHVMSAHYTQV